MRRYLKITRKLRRDGWSVLRLWEHGIEKRTGMCIERLLEKF